MKYAVLLLLLSPYITIHSGQLSLAIPSVGRYNEHQPKGGDALRLGSKGRCGSCMGVDPQKEVQQTPPLPPRRSRPLNAARVWGSAVSSPSGVWGQSPSRNRIWCISALKSEIWCSVIFVVIYVLVFQLFFSFVPVLSNMVTKTC